MQKSPSCRQLHSRSLAAALFAVSLSACEHVSAPQARDAIEKTEAQVLKGNFEAFDGPLGGLIVESRMKAHAAGAGNYQDLSPRIPSGRLVVIRDGRDVDYIATVLERVYAPSPGSGGRPLIRRTLMAWAADSSEEVLVIASEDSIATVALPVSQRLEAGSTERLYGRLAYVIRSPGRRQPASFGNRGSVELRGTSRDGPCPRGVIGVYGNLPTDSTVNCASSWTTVRGHAVLQHGNPENPDVLSLPHPNQESVDIRSQDVPTVRLTTHCRPGVFVRHCETMGFWRDDAQFSRGLGIDVSQLRNDDQLPRVKSAEPVSQRRPGYVWQELDAGSGSEVLCCASYHGPVRYRFLTPTGAVISSGTPSRAADDSLLTRLQVQVYLREGTRLVFVANAGIVAWLTTGHVAQPTDAIVIFELTRPSAAPVNSR